MNIKDHKGAFTLNGASKSHSGYKKTYHPYQKFRLINVKDTLELLNQDVVEHQVIPKIFYHVFRHQKLKIMTTLYSAKSQLKKTCKCLICVHLCKTHINIDKSDIFVD